MNRDEQWLLAEKYRGIQTTGYTADVKRLANGEPLGYVIGWQPFLGLRIYLDSHPLIPRPETEWWTEQLLKVRTSGVLTFLDLCAGSGAIGCAALARLPSACVYFGEIDPAHESTILRNIRENGLEGSRADIRIGDLFEPFGNMTFDVIAANPPYVSTTQVLPASVTDYEPHRALFAGIDGLETTRRIAQKLSKHLAKNGIAWIECGESNAEDARKLFEAQSFNARLLNDQYGRKRIITVSFT